MTLPEKGTGARPLADAVGGRQLLGCAGGIVNSSSDTAARTRAAACRQIAIRYVTSPASS